MIKFKPFSDVHFIEMFFEIPWKNMISLSTLTVIAAICDVIYSFFTDKTYEFDLLDNVFNTLLNTNIFLLWVFLITFLFHVICSITINHRLYYEKKLSLKIKFSLKAFEYTGFFIIEIFYLIGTFCFTTSLLALLILDFHSFFALISYFTIFSLIAIGAHYIYLSVKVNLICNVK